MREGSKNPNWKGGVTFPKKAICNFCEEEFIVKYPSTGKYCSPVCVNRANAQEKHRRAVTKRLSISPKIKVQKPLKKYYCEKCGKNEVIRKTKFCKECRPRRFELHIICKYCGKPAIKYKGEGTIFCNNECKFNHYNGSGNPHFIDGKANERTKLRGSKEYAQWRMAVLNRDNHTCIICGAKEKSMHADHIKPFALYPELRLDISNGRTLCLSCHKQTDTYLKGRKKTDICK